MLQLFKMGGPWSILLAVIAVVILAKAAGIAWRVATGSFPEGRASEVTLQALPFWGVIALLTGFLGQAAGHYKSLSAMISSTQGINPRLVLAGLRECFVTSLMGLVICIVALLFWAALRSWHRVRSAQAA